MRRMSLFLTLLMVLAPMTSMIPELEESTPKLESYEATNGWGESLAYEVIEYDGIDWEVMPTRGVNTWIGNAISNFSDSVDDLDIAVRCDHHIHNRFRQADPPTQGTRFKPDKKKHNKTYSNAVTGCEATKQ